MAADLFGPTPASAEHPAAPGPPAAGPAAGCGVSRRWMFGAVGVGATALVGGTTAGFAVGQAHAPTPTPSSSAADGYDFYGVHQAGIVTPAQDRLHFAAFDVTTTDRAELVKLLRTWTTAASRMTAGQGAGTYGPVSGPCDSPPDDTGEALGLPPSGLTITFGFGPTLFTTAAGVDRFGLAAARPAALIDLPHFPGDALDPARSGGDLCVQACAHDPQVAVHAIRNLARLAFGVAAVRWSQLGFGRTSSTSTDQVTPRNLFGFKDGTANIKVQEPDKLARHVWVGDGGDPRTNWMIGGSFLVARRISMHIETWDRTSLREQEAIIGRNKGAGGPMSGGTELTPLDLDANGSSGPLIPIDAHVRLAHPTQNGGVELLRRGYNFTDGSDGLGRLDAGLFFLAYMRDPVAQYVPMQTTLARDDALSEYLQHTGSGIFAIPPGVPAGGRFVGQALFG